MFKAVWSTKENQNAEHHRALRAQLELEAFGEVSTPWEGQLSEPEVWWSRHFGWLKDRGYLLRPRYSPDWSPSWLGTKKKNILACEDGRVAKFASRLIDATRLSDSSYVVLKLVKKCDHPFELEIGQYFSSQPLAVTNANHCVPIYDTLHIPDDSETSIIVMPLLLDYRQPPFKTVGEAVECFRQLFEGLQFMHKHHVAHRDCTSRNIMMNPTFYRDSFHPVDPKMKRDFSGRARFRTRTSGTPKYFLIDFGLSRRYDSSVIEPREIPIWGADKEVPEFQNSNEPCNPFPTDVFYIGNMIRKDFIELKRGFEFMESLILDMVRQDPSRRPTMDEVTERFRTTLSDLSYWKLRSRVIDKEENILHGVLHGSLHWIRQVMLMTRGVPAIPTPKP